MIYEIEVSEQADSDLREIFETLDFTGVSGFINFLLN